MIFLPLLPLERALQRRQLVAYDDGAQAVGGTLSEVAELVGGAPVVHAYGLEAPHAAAGSTPPSTASTAPSCARRSGSR